MNAAEFFLLIIVAVVSYWIGANSNDPGVSVGLGGVTTDVATGIDFPASSSFAVGKSLFLSGIGTRKKAILNIYSLGFYVSPPLKKQIAKATSKNPCETIRESNHPKAVQLTFAMGIGPEKIAEAISQLNNVDEQVKKDFHDLLIEGMGDGKMKKGESMTFEWKGADTIVATARGTGIGEMKDSALAAGILELYLDSKKGVSPSLLENLGCRK